MGQANLWGEFVTVFFAPDVTGTELQGFADAVLSAQS